MQLQTGKRTPRNIADASCMCVRYSSLPFARSCSVKDVTSASLSLTWELPAVPEDSLLMICW